MLKRDPTLLLIAIAVRGFLQAIGLGTIYMYTGPTPGYDFVVKYSGLAQWQLASTMAATAGLTLLALNQRYRSIRGVCLIVTGCFWVLYGSTVFLGDIRLNLFSPSAAFDVLAGLVCSLLAPGWWEAG